MFELLVLITLALVLFGRRNLNRVKRQVADLTARVQYLESAAELQPDLAGTPSEPQLEVAQQVTEASTVETAAPREASPTAAHAPARKTPERLWAAWAKSAVDVADWEALIGGNWLNKIGIVVLVVGVSLFLSYSLRYLGPLGRVATGLVTSLALLAGGVFLERIEKYSLFAKPLIGGGWALLYFTTYAAHNIEAAKVIQEPTSGLVLLGLVAAGMILHSLRYKSQIVTCLAYFLGFLTVAISPLTGFSLVASSILAASLVAILRTTRWYPLGIFGLAATYLNHLLWLEYRIGGPTELAPDGSFWLSQAMLVLYWVLFAAFDFLLKPENKNEQRLSLAINLANALAFLGLSLRQVGVVFPEAQYLLTGFTSVAYMATSYLLRLKGRQGLFLTNGSVAVVLVALTSFFKLPSSPLTRHWLAIGWLIEAGVVLALGRYLKEIVFRAQAYLLSVCVLGALFFINLYGAPEPSHLLRWTTVLPAVAYFYSLLWWLQKDPGTEHTIDEEKYVGSAFSFAGSALLTVLCWKELDPVAVALAWGFLSLILLEAGIRFQRVPLRFQGYLLSALAFGRLFLANFTAPGSTLGLSHKVVSVVPIIAIFYYLVHRVSEDRNIGRIVAHEKYLPQLHSYGAAVLLLVLARFEFGRSLTVIAWAIIGLTFFTLGIIWQDRDLRIQSCFIAILTFWRSWSTNVFLIGSVYGIPERIATTVPVIVSLYALTLLFRYRQGDFPKPEASQKLRALALLDAHSRNLFSVLASLLLAIFLYHEVQGNLLTVAWTIQGLGLMAAGFLVRERTLRLSGLGLFAVCLLKVFFIDLSGLEMIYRIFSFIVLGIILLIVSFGYTRYKDVIKRYI